MSMHEIEGLVEDSIRLLNESNKTLQVKRELIYNLYQFQAMFDTGYTHFRVKDILTQNRYLYAIPLKDYPDFQDQPEKIAETEKTLEQQRSHWIDNYYTEKDKLTGATLLYFDYGSELWLQRVKNNTLEDSEKPPSQLSITQLAYIMMQEDAEQKAEQESINPTKTNQNDQPLILQWYVMTSNCFAEEYIEKNTYKDFLTFLKDSNVIESKALAMSAGIKTYKERNGYLTLQQWHHVRDGIEKGNLDKLFTLRFWLDFETRNDQLLLSYNTEQTKLNQLNKDGIKQKKITLIPDELNKVLTKEKGWNFEKLRNTEDDIEWLWYKDSNGTAANFSDDYYRQSIKVRFDKQDQGLHCDLGLQLGKILRWQKRQPHPLPAFWHFYTNLMINFDEVMDQNIAENKNRLDAIGLWKFRLTQSNKKLTESIHAFADYLTEQGEHIFQANLTEFNEKLFHRDSEKLMHIMEYGENDTGIIPDYILFNSAAMIPLMFLFNAIDHAPAGDDLSKNKNVMQYYQQFKDSFDALHPKGASKLYLEPLHSFKSLTENGMPLMIHFQFINYFKDNMSKPTQ